MAAFSIITWNETTKSNKRQVSSQASFDFQAVRIGADNLTIDQAGSGAGATFNFNNRRLGGLSDAQNNTEAVSKGQMDAAISLAVLTGGSLKEAVLIEEQLSASLGIRAAMVLYMTAAATAGDQVNLNDGTNVESWTFTSGAPSANTPATGANANASMQNLAARIDLDSTIWGAKYVATGLASMNSSGGVVVIYEKSVASGLSTSRAYGVFNTQADVQVVQYNGQSEYKTSTAPVTLPTGDPSAGRFGFRRTLANLTNGEIHYVHETDVMRSWDDDGNLWTTFQNGSVPDGTSASGGGVKGKLALDSDFGLQATAGVARIVTDNQGLGFNAGNLALILDGATLSKSGSGVKVADQGITATQLASSAFAGGGLTGGNGSAVAVGAGDGISVGATTVAVNYNEQLINDNAGAITQAQVVYIKNNGNVDLAQADISNLHNFKLGVVNTTSIAAAGTGAVAVRTGARISGFSGLTPGQSVYVSRSTPGAVTQDLSAFVTGEHVYRVGHALTASVIVFNPEHKLEL